MQGRIDTFLKVRHSAATKAKLSPSPEKEDPVWISPFRFM
jgi:hypothetical protein